jgi:hypothetical protein
LVDGEFLLLLFTIVSLLLPLFLSLQCLSNLCAALLFLRIFLRVSLTVLNTHVV